MRKKVIILSIFTAILFLAANFLPIDASFGLRINESDSLPHRR
jgi:hypothetical protein